MYIVVLYKKRNSHDVQSANDMVNTVNWSYLRVTQQNYRLKALYTSDM